MRVRARSGFGSCCTPPREQAGCICIGMLGQICDLTMCVCASYNLSRKEAFGDCGSDHVPLLSVPGKHRFIAIRTHTVPPHLSPCRLPPCSACLLTLIALGVGKVLLRCKATTRAGACKPISCGVPGQVQCWRVGRAVQLAGGGHACFFWPASCLTQGHASPPGCQGGAKDISLRLGFGSLGCAV